MTDVTASFTAKAVSGTLLVPEGQAAIATVANTFVGTVELQRAIGSGGWETVAKVYAADVRTITVPGTYRYVCTRYVSGTADVTLSPAAAGGVSNGSWQTDSFASGAGPFALTYPPAGLVMVFFDGVQQPTANYSVVGSSLALAGGADYTLFDTIRVIYAH